MLFNSYLFLFLFLPLFLAGWHTLNHFGRHRAATLFLAGMSLWFYAAFHPAYLLLILSSMGVNYGLSALLEAHRRRASGTFPAAKLIRVLGILFNLGLFGYFKYFDFFVDNVNALLGTGFHERHILLPLGISFFTFQQLSFILDRCRGEAEHCAPEEYAAFVSFFPQLVAGPIVLQDEFLPQLRDTARRRFDAEKARRGAGFFVLGLAKKVLLADYLALPVALALEYAPGTDAPTVLLSAMSYGLELYFDFSGYCDMASGLALMAGFELPVNFDSPYQSVSFREFWRRWHITLNRFFTRYVYIPLGGSRRGEARTAVNLMLVFLLSGLWHGASWNFVIWGGLNGLAVLAERWISGLRQGKAPRSQEAPGKTGRSQGTARTRVDAAPAVTASGGTGGLITYAKRFGIFLYYSLTLIFFRAESFRQAVWQLQGLLRWHFPGCLTLVARRFEPSELYLAYTAVKRIAPALFDPFAIGVWVLLVLLGLYLAMARPNTLKRPTPKAFYLALLLVWCILSFSRVSTFLYFNF